MEIAASVVAKVVELAVDPVVRQLGYLFCYTRNTKEFEGQVQSLKIRRDDIQSKVKEANDKGDSILKRVVVWLKDVEKIPEESENFITEEINANRKCVNGMCPNLWRRYYVSREAKKKTEALAKLYVKGDFHDFAVRVPLAEIESSSNMNQVVFEFKQTTFRKIMDALNDKNASIIGICGMGGVGKTTLLEEIRKQAGEKKLFDMLLMVTVSQNPNFKSIQQEIADMIGLQFTEKTPEARAKRLHWRLCEILKEKKLLFLVDDVWKMLNLEQKVGIPYGENYKGSRIVLTSRSRDVCDQMGCKATYQLEGLNDDEAWGLFKGLWVK